MNLFILFLSVFVQSYWPFSIGLSVKKHWFIRFFSFIIWIQALVCYTCIRYLSSHCALPFLSLHMFLDEPKFLILSSNSLVNSSMLRAFCVLLCETLSLRLWRHFLILVSIHWWLEWCQNRACHLATGVKLPVRSGMKEM